MAFKQNLKRHMMKSHGDGKDANDKHKCEKCPFKGDKRHLKEYVERVHDKVKNEMCKYCDKAFFCKYDLSLHIRRVHEKIKDHVCPHCNPAFSIKGNLNKHVRAIHGKST